MTVISRGWDRLTLPGKVLFTAIPLVAALTVGLVLAIILFAAPVIDLAIANLPIVRFLVAATVILLMTVPTAFLIIYMEMKVIALMNLRIGPDRVGPFGMDVAAAGFPGDVGDVLGQTVAVVVVEAPAPGGVDHSVVGGDDESCSVR